MDRPAAVRLAFVNASEAGVPDQPMAFLLSVKGVSPNCPEARMRAVLTARAGRRARTVGCRGPCVFERLMYMAAFFLIGNVRPSPESMNSLYWTERLRGCDRGLLPWSSSPTCCVGS